MEVLNYGVSLISNFYLIAVVLVGTVIGILVGAMPGLGSVMMIAILIPFTISMEPMIAISLVSALYCASTYGGSITAILINAPGTPASAATTFDGYPMAQRGEAGRALGIANVSSAIGGIFSIIIMIIAAPLLARLAYKFGAPEYFALALFGLSMLASISSGSSVKNLIGGALGILISTVGLDFTTGVERFTFGFPELTEGLNFIPVMIGLFGGAELLKQSATLHIKYKIISHIAMRLPSLLDFKKLWVTILRSSAIGTFIGILPAEGGTVASMIGYNEARRWSKNKEEFGNGAIEGIAGPESANNAATGGAMVPTLALGIPGSGSTAVILGAMLMHGLRPGPSLFSQQPMILYAIFFSMLLANILFLVFGMLGTKLFARVTLIPRTFLWPVVFILASVGSYALKQSLLDVWIMLSFSFVGFLLKRFGFSAAPIVIGLILGELVETSLKQSLVIFEGNWALFLNRPLVVVFFILTFTGLFWQPVRKGLILIKDKVNSKVS